jgi:hypothetical protein
VLADEQVVLVCVPVPSAREIRVGVDYGNAIKVRARENDRRFPGISDNLSVVVRLGICYETGKDVGEKRRTMIGDDTRYDLQKRNHDMSEAESDARRTHAESTR